MNREQRRMRDKSLKQVITDKQLESLKDEAMALKVEIEIQRFMANFIAAFIPAMKENRIGSERAKQILLDVASKARLNFKKGETGIPCERSVSQDNIENVISDELKERGIENSDLIANIIYMKISRLDKGVW